MSAQRSTFTDIPASLKSRDKIALRSTDTRDEIPLRDKRVPVVQVVVFVPVVVVPVVVVPVVASVVVAPLVVSVVVAPVVVASLVLAPVVVPVDVPVDVPVVVELDSSVVPVVLKLP